MIYEFDTHMFTRGGCLVLAEMISEETGLPIYSMNTENYPDEPDLHAFVQTPDGLYLDIEGKHTEQEMMDRWSAWKPTAIVRCDPSDFDWSWTQRGEDEAQDYEERAAQLIPELLEMV